MALAIICGILGFIFGTRLSSSLLGTSSGFHGESSLVFFGLMFGYIAGFWGYQVSQDEWQFIDLPLSHMALGLVAGVLGGKGIFSGFNFAFVSKSRIQENKAEFEDRSGNQDDKVAAALLPVGHGLSALAIIAGINLGFQLGNHEDPLTVLTIGTGLAANFGGLIGAVTALVILLLVLLLLGSKRIYYSEDSSYESPFFGVIRWVPIFSGFTGAYLAKLINDQGWSWDILSVGLIGGWFLGFFATLCGLFGIMHLVQVIVEIVNKTAAEKLEKSFTVNHYGTVYGYIIFILLIIGAHWGSQISQIGWDLSRLRLGPSGVIISAVTGGAAGIYFTILISRATKILTSIDPRVIDDKLLRVGVTLFFIFIFTGIYFGMELFINSVHQ